MANLTRPTTTGRTDDWGALMAAAQRGDAAAYRRLLHGLTPLVRSWLRRRGLDHWTCEDLAQDVLMTVHRVRHTYDPARPFAPWLAAIVRRRMIDRLRRDAGARSREVYDPLLIAGIPAEETADALEARDAAALLHDALASLPACQREALSLTKVQELSVAEAASRTGRTPGALRVSAHRALRALQARFAGLAAAAPA